MTHHGGPQPHRPRSTGQRARRSFWLLVVVAVLATGGLSSGLTADPSPITGLWVAAIGSVLIVSLALAARVMIACERAGAARRALAPGTGEPDP